MLDATTCFLLCNKNLGCIAGTVQHLRILQLQTGELLLGLPDPGFVGREEQVHLLEGAALGLGVEGPDDRDGEKVDAAVDEEGVLRDCCGRRREIWWISSLRYVWRRGRKKKRKKKSKQKT